MSKPQLGYWDNRTIVEPIRLLLALAGVDYEDVRYSVGEPPSYDKSQWLKAKHSLGLAAPNLPYWIEPGPDGELRLTQSRAILLHIAETHGFAGTSPHQKALIHMALETMSDMFDAFMKVTYCNVDVASAEPGVHVAGEPQARATSPKFERLRADYLAETLPVHLVHMARLLEHVGSGGGGGGMPTGWLVGASAPTCADLMLFELLDQHLIFAPRCLDVAGDVAGGDEGAAGRAALRAHHARVLALPAIAAYKRAAAPEPLHNRYSHFHRGWAPPDDWARRGPLAAPQAAPPRTPPRGGNGGGTAVQTMPANAVFVFDNGRPLDEAARASHERQKRRNLWRDVATFIGFGLCLLLLVAIGRAAIKYDPETLAETQLITSVLDGEEAELPTP